MSDEATEPNSAEAEDEGERQSAPKIPTWVRLGALAVLFFGSLAIAHFTGLIEEVTVERIREAMRSAGPLGFVGFIVMFAVGELMHIPGIVFVGAAAVAYGTALGIPVAYIGALTSVAVSFVVVRTIGGQPLSAPKRKWVRRALSQLDERPVITVTALRFVFWMAPFLNYALAMTKVRFRDYMLGSAIAFAFWIPIIVIFFDEIATLSFTP